MQVSINQSGLSEGRGCLEERQRFRVRTPPRSKSHNLMRALERPAAIRNLWTPSEIDLIEVRTSPCPMIGRSAEKAQAALLQRHRDPDAGTRIQRMRFREFILQPAAFDEADAQGGSCKFPCDGNAGGTRAFLEMEDRTEPCLGPRQQPAVHHGDVMV